MADPVSTTVTVVRTTEHVFKDTVDRDLFIQDFFPTRTCTDVPGFYTLPDGRTLEVFMETITVHEVLNPQAQE